MYRTSLILVLAGALSAAPSFATRTSTHAAKATARSSAHVKGGRRAAAPPKVKKLHGQQVIAPERATEIQQALIREHYMTGPATGEWDSDTVAAMQKYQSDQGWQTKLMPDSRALKKLGLGADYSNVINAKGSSFAAPPPARTIPAGQAAGFTAASGVHQ